MVLTFISVISLAVADSITFVLNFETCFHSFWGT